MQALAVFTAHRTLGAVDFLYAEHCPGVFLADDNKPLLPLQGWVMRGVDWWHILQVRRQSTQGRPE